MTIANIKTLVFTAVVVCSFFMGAYVKSLQCDKRVAELQASMQNELNEAQENALALSRQLALLTTTIDEEGLANEDAVNSDYAAYLDWVHQQGSGTASDGEASDTAGTSQTAQTCDCRLYEKSKRAYGELQKDILTLTRDCDITAVRYNELLNLCVKTQDLLK